MQIVYIETLISVGLFPISQEWQGIKELLHEGIRKVEWPPGSGKFTIYPESGKKRGQGNGVMPIKLGLMEQLRGEGWQTERYLDIAASSRPGKLDVVFTSQQGIVAMEWETGNISSSHRALNKMAVGLHKGLLVGGVLIVPSRNLYRYLTDRIGNYDELAPYFDLWRCIPCTNGILELVVIEYDETSTDVPRIPKGTSGRALE